MKVCVIGLGYIGFPTACVVARAGHNVLGVDVNSDLIDKLNNGGRHIVNENGLAEITREAFSSGRLRVSRSPEPADVFILAVPTPCRGLPDSIEIGAAKKEVAAAVQDFGPAADVPGECRVPAGPRFGADLTYLEQAARDIAPYLRPGNLVVLV